MDIEKIKDIAISEVKYPTWSLTKQFLYVNKVVCNDGVPVIADITFSEEDVANVWFPIVGESYYFVTYVDCKPSPELRFVGISAGNRVCLVVVSDDSSSDELTGTLQGVEFSSTWRKGEIKRETKRGNILWENSGFEIEPYPKTSGEVEDKVRAIINLLKDQKQQMTELTKKADHVELSIAYFGYKDQMWGIHLEPEVVRELGELGVSMDIDLYASGPDLLDVPE